MIKQYNSCYGPLLRLALPVVASQAGQMSVVLADTVMVGGLGERELAAVSFSGNLTVPVMYAGIGIALCVTPLVGRRLGAGRDASIAFCLKQSQLLNWLVGICQTLIMIALWALIPYMGQPAEVVEVAMGYLPILIASMIPAQIFVGYKQVIEGLHNTSIPMRISLAGNVLNVAFNYIFIYGLGPIAAMGVNGAAWGTLLSRLFMWGAIEVVVRRHSICRGYSKLTSSISTSWRIVAYMVRQGAPIGGQMVVECLGFAMGGIMMGWVGTSEMAAHQVVMSFTSLTYLMASGIASAITIKVSVFSGQSDNLAVRRYAGASLIMVVLFMLCTACVLIVGRHALPGLIIDAPSALAVAVSLMVLGGMFQVFDGVQVVCLGILRGLGDMVYPAIVSGVAYAATCLPVGYLMAFVFGMGGSGVWIGYIVGLLVASVMLLCRLRIMCRKMEADAPRRTA